MGDGKCTPLYKGPKWLKCFYAEYKKFHVKVNEK